ncbi:hypothetical protein JRQ81_006750 [Phrynocephalus forsythii]|uniref:Neugrin n=1 Tax=Phrynocephalus forsythii TaxID=171643 RepID=A0A9Q0XGY1_9SAUR|nr:hypothetical protein JRQ81_006750 [Phrynocephalus forsythii]
MEQIRYLSRELPEEWPVARLAQGFQVPPDVIRRVLKSRFVPSPECAKKQDATALARWGLQKESSCLETSLTREATFRVLTPPLLPQPASELPVLEVGQKKPKKQEGPRAPSNSSRQEEEAQTGQVLSLAGLEQLAAEDWHKHNPAWVPMQRGWEFFDPEGNLLYKVPVVGHLETGKDSQ